MKVISALSVPYPESACNTWRLRYDLSDAKLINLNDI